MSENDRFTNLLQSPPVVG